MESNKSDIIVAKKLNNPHNPINEYGTDILEYTGFIISDIDDTIRNRSASSAVKATELYQKLKNNYWFLEDTRYFVQGIQGSEFDFQIRFTEFNDRHNPKSGEIDTINDSAIDVNERGGFPVCSYINADEINDINKARAYGLEMNFREFRDEMIEDLYDTVFGTGDEDTTLPGIEKIFYDSSKTRVSLLIEEGQSCIMNLVEAGSDIYTNKISLGPLINSDLFHPGAKCIIDISINFSKDGKIYSRTAMFPVFKYTESGIQKEEINLDIAKEIRVHFDKDSNILSLAKLDQSIDEYIIEGCTARILL